MHPEIRAFWETLGEVDLTPSAPHVYYVVKLYSNNGYVMIAAISNNTAVYWYDEVSYTESQMLRIIRLKAFL